MIHSLHNLIRGETSEKTHQILIELQEFNVFIDVGEILVVPGRFQEGTDARSC